MRHRVIKEGILNKGLVGEPLDVFFGFRCELVLSTNAVPHRHVFAVLSPPSVGYSLEHRRARCLSPIVRERRGAGRLKELKGVGTILLNSQFFLIVVLHISEILYLYCKYIEDMFRIYDLPTSAEN